MDFLIRLNNLFSSEGLNVENSKFPPFFPHDLMRLVFEWFIFMKREFHGSASILRKQIKNYEYLMKYFPIPFSSNYQMTNLFFKYPLKLEDIKFWTPLIYLEAKSREKEMINSIVSISNAFYHGEEAIRGNCRKIRDLYFKNGLDNDIILKFLIILSNDKIFKGGNELCLFFER